MDFSGNTYQVNTGFGKPRFSKVEVVHIAISILVLALGVLMLIPLQPFLQSPAHDRRWRGARALRAPAFGKARTRR